MLTQRGDDSFNAILGVPSILYSALQVEEKSLFIGQIFGVRFHTATLLDSSADWQQLLTVLGCFFFKPAALVKHGT